QHAKTQTMTVGNFLTDNDGKLIVLNIDDFHNIHEDCRSDSTLTHNTLHFITVLLKALPNTVSIPNIEERSIHNEKAFVDLISVPETHEERVEHLLVHSYDNRIEQ
ncbi:4600_t:CDS:2, partial [Gigaspora rosea]